MNNLRLVYLAFILCLCSCGTASRSVETVNPNPIVPQTDPLVVELESFEGYTFGGERSFLALYNNMIKGQIPTVAGMIRTGIMTSNYALTFDKCEARISEPRIDKKGTSYSFTVNARDAQFFNSWTTSDWRIMYTVFSDGRVNVNVESDRIGAVGRTRTWRFYGHVNKDRTEAAKLFKANDPSIF